MHMFPAGLSSQIPSVYVIPLRPVRSTPSSRAACYPLHSVRLPAEIFEIGNPLLNLAWQNRDRTSKQFRKHKSCLCMETYVTSLISFVKMWYKQRYPSNFMFEFACIISLYYIKNQQDATWAVLFISNCKITLNVSYAFCVHHQEY